jgi:uncharacterized damage-inducible protein DinB
MLVTPQETPDGLSVFDLRLIRHSGSTLYCKNARQEFHFYQAGFDVLPFSTLALRKLALITIGLRRSVKSVQAVQTKLSVGEWKMRYNFLIETYATERVKVISTWAMFKDEDLSFRPRPNDIRGRSLHEHMVHQCVSEDFWFRTMLNIGVQAPPLPENETRLEFMKRYAEDSGKRLAALQETSELWWEQDSAFFDVERTRAWIVTRRIAHTAHHRGQQLTLLRMLGRDLYSNYGPTADTGGLMQNHAPTIYAYPDLATLLASEAIEGGKTPLPEPAQLPVTERPVV